jgi:hypothetical protein
MADELTVTQFLNPTTLLQAVNVCLGAVSTTQISTLAPTDLNTDAEEAVSKVGESLREVQEEGWVWNQEFEYEIAPSADDEIVLPANCLKVIQLYNAETSTKRLIQRGQKLYDTRNHTYVIGETVKVDMYVALDFEAIPESARRYITLRAARRFSANKMVSTSLYKITKADEDEARLRMEQASAEMDPDSMLQNPHIVRMRRGRT